MRKNTTADVKRKISFLVIASLLAVSFQLKSQDQADSLQLFKNGKQLFGTKCGSCHAIHHENIGPALASVTKKKSTEWLLEFIRNSQSVITGNDPYAKRIYYKYNHVMPSFSQLTESELQGLLYFIERESKISTSYSDFDLAILQNSNGDILYGRQLFNQQCSSCHSIYYEKYGPALGSVTKRLDVNWLIPFVRNSQQVILNGDPYANHLFKSFGNKIMVNMEFLTDEQLKGIFTYVEYASNINQPVSVNTKTDISISTSSSNTNEQIAKSKKENLIGYKMLVFGVLLMSIVAVAFILINVNQYLRKEHHD